MPNNTFTSEILLITTGHHRGCYCNDGLLCLCNIALCIGHTLRKEDGEIPKSALLWNPQGNRKRGKPRNSWRRSVNKEAGRSWNELRFLAADRRKWKGLIDNLCS
jgi:hypothetical protein